MITQKKVHAGRKSHDIQYMYIKYAFIVYSSRVYKKSRGSDPALNIYLCHLYLRETIVPGLAD